MFQLMSSKEMDIQTGWTSKQRNHLRCLIKEGATIAYVCTDSHGRPSNGGPNNRKWQVKPGLVQKIKGPLQICTAKGLHGTFLPHKWNGTRVFVAGFLGPIQRDSDKIASLNREIVGEVYPECAISDSVGVRIGRKDLNGANLYRAYLPGSDLSSANLSSAYLAHSDLSDANLSRSNLVRTNLSYANLSNANLSGAELYCANLSYANLANANLSYANLSYTIFIGANLIGAYTTAVSIDGWTIKNNIVIRKA